MLYLLYGTDWKALLDGRQKLIVSLQKKEEFPVVVLGETNAINDLEHYFGGRMLFGNTGHYIVTAKRVLETAEQHDFIVDRLETLASSPNFFIFSEEKITSADLKLFKKFSETTEEFSLNEGVVKKNDTFNIFSVTDALGRRDRKNLWLLMQRALRSGLVAEELFWKYVWQVKTMLLVSSGANEKEAGLHPFVYKKALSNAKNYSHQELVNLSEKLLVLYHEDRRGRRNIETGLELLTLTL
jgi:DNA polymerase III delta subunit